MNASITTTTGDPSSSADALTVDPRPWCRIRLANSSPKHGTAAPDAAFITATAHKAARAFAHSPTPLPLHSPWERARKSGSRVLDVDARASPPEPKRVTDQYLPCHLTVLLLLLHETEASDIAAAEWAITPYI
ncbi:hypothetical protein B0H19DRAFT_1274807 [Mycena capillaripes]|nr:hypothetical protein B0H19DRAFT_1274807 [Mycena capillaripes]